MENDYVNSIIVNGTETQIQDYGRDQPNGVPVLDTQGKLPTKYIPNNVWNDVKGYVDSSNSYSTNEVKTGGKWIDGKPIYRKVLITTTLINGGEIGWGGLESNITSLNIDNCIASYAIIEHLGMRYLQYMPDQGGFIPYYSGIPDRAKVVMEYTKTTD